MSKIEIIEKTIKELDALRDTLDQSNPKKLEVVRELDRLSTDLGYLKRQEQEQKEEQQTPPKISKKIEAKKEKRDSKLKKALEAGARVVERSISKVGWDMAHGKVKVVSGKLDYRSWQILDSAASERLVFLACPQKLSIIHKNGNFICRWREKMLDVDQWIPTADQIRVGLEETSWPLADVSSKNEEQLLDEYMRTHEKKEWDFENEEWVEIKK